MRLYLGHIPQAAQYYRENQLDCLIALDLATCPLNDDEASTQSVKGLNILPIKGPWDYASRLLPDGHLEELIIGSGVPSEALRFIRHAYKNKARIIKDVRNGKT